MLETIMWIMFLGCTFQAATAKTRKGGWSWAVNAFILLACVILLHVL